MNNLHFRGRAVSLVRALSVALQSINQIEGAARLLFGGSMSTIDQQIRNWFHELQEHDLSDLRGIVGGLAKVLELLALKIPSAPPPAPIHGEGFVLPKGGRDA